VATDQNGDGLVEAHGVTKRFGERVAVDGIDFAVRRGEAFGFLGPNGAGKSSTMKMIGCVSTPTAGTLTVFGDDVVRHGPAIRARLGVVPQEDNLDNELSVLDNLIIYGRYFGLPHRAIRRRAEELLEFMQLADRADARVDPLSGGMKRRLTIARALVNEPQLLLLDEPTTGLDPQVRHLLWDRLYQLRRESGISIVLTTHYMDEAEQLCDRLVIMDGGRIVAQGSPARLIADHAARDVVELRFADPTDREAALAVLDRAGRAEVAGERLLVYTDDAEAVLKLVHDEALTTTSVLSRRGSLEDVFLILTGRSLED
jgi:lipooligosaccharide transport system ATP-binding protein